MKKILLGTTALATAVLLTNAAHAADDGLKLTLGGFFSGVVLAGDDGNNNSRGISFDSWNSEISFTAEATAANGLTYGFQIQLEGASVADQIDEAYLYLSGGFGRIELGTQDPVAAQMGYVAPSPDATGVLTVNSGDYFINAFTYNSDGDAGKINYFTPRIGGFQLGLSYSPDGTQDPADGAVSGGFEPDNNVNGAGQQFTAGLNYSKEFSGVTLGLSGTYAWLEVESPTVGMDDQTSWGLGANIGFGAGAGTVTLGGSYLNITNFNFADSDDVSAYDAGVQYAQGPFTVGVQSIWWDQDSFADTIWGISVGGGYKVAAGLDLSLGYMHWDNQGGGGGAFSNTNADVFLFGTTLSF
ncbi:porin [Zavarzinia compransoris]|nr:porin [Zavarzinia compransoris]TDP43750.1 porin-like protein [Zavarzinia compransoris]